MICSRRFRKRLCIKQVSIAAVIALVLYGALSSTVEDVRDYDLPNLKKRLSGQGQGQDQGQDHPLPVNVVRPPEIVRHTTVLPRNVSQDKHGCEHWFSNTFEENLEQIARYPHGNSDEYIWKVGGNLTQPKSMATSFPVIVTAANSGFYGVSQGLLKSIHEILMPVYGNITIIYYDMGLTADQRIQLKKFCRCEVRQFPFEEFPSHVRSLKTYTWKPLIVKKVLMEYGWVWWMDSSVRFVSNDLDSAIQYSKDNSVLFFTYGVVLSVAQHTDVKTMTFLGEDRCKFRHFGEIEATFVLFHFDHVTKTLVDTWARCALVPDCMCPPGTAGKLGCHRGNTQDGRCHRFDQAVLSIMLRRLYHDQNDYPLVDEPFHIHTIKRGNRVNYFPSS